MEIIMLFQNATNAVVMNKRYGPGETLTIPVVGDLLGVGEKIFSITQRAYSFTEERTLIEFLVE